MKPDVWGSTYWVYLHLLSISFPDQPSDHEKINLKKFLKIFPETIPCVKCKTHFIKNLKQYDLDKMLKNKKTFMEFIWILHNNVNDLLKKQTVDYNIFLTNYNKALSGSMSLNPFFLNKKIKKYEKIVIFLIAIIVLIITTSLYIFLK